MGVNATMGGTKDYGLKVFPQETMDKIEEEFCNYFKRKNGAKFTRADAKMLIDYHTGPTPSPTDVNGTDYSRTVVSGGGSTRPTEADMENVLSKYYGVNDETSEWDGVFDELLELYDGHPWGKKLIHMAFRDNERVSDICQEITIIAYDIDGKDFDKNKYIRNRNVILTQAGVIAYEAGLIDLVSR